MPKKYLYNTEKNAYVEITDENKSLVKEKYAANPSIYKIYETEEPPVEEQEGGEPVNFTEGSGEQQEQPTEPLEKPIVDVDRFDVPETDEYLSGAREAAAKELRETEKILSGVAKSPTKVLDYKSYDPIQLDSAMSDVDKKLEQINFILSTRGLTQPQRTTAKKERDRLKEEKAIATVVRAVGNNNYGMLDDAKEAIAFVGPNRIVGKELSKEYEKLESRVNNDINEKFVDIDFNKLTEIDNQGIERADVAKISDLSDEIATSMAEGDEAVRQLVYEKLFDRAENNRFVNESIKRASENEVIQKLQSDKLSSFQDTNESAIKFKAEASSSAKKINDKAESELNTLSQGYTKNVQNYFSDLQSKVSQGLMTAEDAQKDYDSYNQELYKNLKEQQNLIVNEAESAIKGINELYSQKIQKGYEEFSKNNPLSQEERDLLSTEYGKIYEEIRDDEFKRLKGQETLDYIKYGGAGLAFDFGKSLNSTLSRAISGAGTYFGSPSLVEIGDEMNTSFSVADEPLENWSDLANIPAVTKSIGRLAGSAAPSIIVGSAVSAGTAGLGTVPAMALVATTGFVTESIDMAGNIKRDVIRETGSLLKGEQAAGAMWEAQMGNWWTYLGDGLPFVSKALKFIPSKTGRILTAGGESVATETPQEIFQTSQEQKIMESVRSGEEISAKGFMELITPELAKSTFLEVAPGSLFLGGGSRVVTEVRMQGQANQIVKDLIDNINLNGVDKNQSFIKQKIFSSINRHGKNFTNSWLSTLQENGVITEEQLTELYTFSKTAEGFSRNIKNTNLTDEQQQTYFGLSHRANELFDKADAITDDKVLKSSLTQEANELKKNAQSFLSNPETGGSFVTVKIGKSPALVLTESEAIEFVTNNPYVVLPESGVDIVARNADEFGGILEQMAKGVEAGIADLKSIDDYGKQQSGEGRLLDVDNTLTKINNAEYINDSEIDAGIEQIFDEVDRVDGLDISDNAKESIKQQLFGIAETLDNYEFRTKTETRKVTPEQPVEGRAETKREIPKKSTSKAEIPGVGTVNLTFTGRNTISITPKGQEGTTARVTTFTFPENFLYTNEQGDFTALVIEDAEGNQITINDPEIGVPLAINNIIAETAAVPTGVVEEFVTEEINYIKERKEAAPKAKEAAPVEEAVEEAPTGEQKLKDISEGRVVTFTYPNKQSIPDIFKDKVSSTINVTEKRGASKTTYKVTISQSEADYLLSQGKVAPTVDTEGAETTTELTEEQVSELNKFLDIDKSKRKASRKGITKKDNQRLDKVERAVDLLEQSLSEVMPNIVISVAEDSDMFARFAGEQEEKKEDRSKGLFTRVDGTYVIVLNPDSADVTTVFHEGLHAVLKASGLPNTMARAVTSRMVEAVKKTATKKLQKELKAFTELYETPLQSEEYIAELIGILANNYNEQNNETKSVIRRWLQKLAEMLGLKPKGVSLSTVGLNNTDAATIDALNFVAKKMSEGGVLTEQDLTRLVQPGKEQQGDGSEETVTRKRKRKKPKSKVKDAFEWGMQNGVPAIAVKNHLIKLGYTEEEITSGAYDAEKIWNKDGKKVVKWLDYGRRAALSARKFRPQTMFLAMEAMESSISAELRQAKMMAEKLNRAINKYKSQDKRDELIDAVDEFMRDAEERDFWRNELPDDIAQIAEAMRVHIDSLSLKLVDSGVIKAESSRENILANIGVYMNRSYQVFDNKNWKEEVSEQVITAAQNHLREAYYNSLNGIKELDQQLKDGKITESEYNRRKNRILSNKASVKEIMDRDNVSEDEALNMHVDDVINSILSKKDVNDYILFAQPKVGKKDLSSLKRRKDIPPAIRALMGEYTDPGYNYAMSIFKIANLVENQKYLTKIRDAGLGVWLFEKEAGKKIPEGYEEITFEGDASMNPLDGLHAPKEVKEAFEDIELNKFISGMPKIGWLYGFWLKGVGAVKYSKTILSYGTHAKNVIGNMYFMAQNGYLDPREYQQPFIALVKQFSGKELTAEQEAKMDEWVRAGIIGQGATIGEIKSFFEGEDSFEKALTKRIDKKTDNMLSKVKKGVKKFGEKAQEAYQYEDDMFKIVAYEKEKLNYSKILFDGKSYNQLDASQQSTVNDYVAEIIKNILPNYGRIGGFGKGLKFFPIAGTFISFQIEAYRTAYNTVALAIQEIKGDIPGISETGKKLVQKRGVMRLISIVGFQAFKYGLISLLGIPLIPGDDDDEDGLSEKIRTLLPFWDTNSDISVREVKPNGNFTYVSISASDPYGSIFKVVNATKNSAKTGEGFSEIFGELSGPFVSEDILLNTLRNISSNENDYGGKIWRNTDTPFEKSEKIALQLYKAFEPGGITSTRKIIQSENKLNEALGQFTGFKLHEVKSLEQAGFKFGDIQKKAQESKSAYNSIKYNMDDYETQEDINKVIRASKKAMDEDYQEAVKLYQALISLGVSDRDVKKKMYDYGISAKMRSQIARNSVDVKLNPIKK